MVEEFLSEDEELMANYGSFHLTDDRVIELVESNRDREYKDIQLENIASFQHSKKFNETLAAVGGLAMIGGFPLVSTDLPTQVPVIISLLGLAAIIHAYLSINEKYVIRSDAGTKFRLPDSSNSIKFWKEINQEKNH